MKLHIQVIRNSEGITLKLDGVLDETAELPAFDLAYCGRMVIDLEKLTMINSLGCRKWIHWLKAYPQGTQISLTKCSPVIVNQINILVGFVPPGVDVESIFVPYYCGDCGGEELVLLATAGARAGGFSPDSVHDDKECVHCKAKAELDVIKSRYFHFLVKKAA
jgi:hypothetical protein